MSVSKSLVNPPEVKGTPKTTTYIQTKIERCRDGKRLRVLDLFSGCGGLSFGFHKAGFEIIGAIELDSDAANSHASNFHSGSSQFEEHCKSRDIQSTEPKDFFEKLGLEGHTSEQIDVIIGGPPCQAFTRVGRAKLREIRSDSNAFLNDPRSQLYKRYLEYVKQLKPLAILMENVPDVLNYGGVNIADLVCKDLTSQGYKCKYTLLNTVYYGIPQMRERMFLVAIHQEFTNEFIFPEPTHYVDLPTGYHGSRSVALKHINPESNPYYIQSPIAAKGLKSAVTVKSALSDLPKLTQHLQGVLKKKARDLSEELSYRSKKAKNDFQNLMRTWFQESVQTKVSANVIRILPRDYPIFKKMREGDQYPEAVKVAQNILKRKLKREEKCLGKKLAKHSNRYNELLSETVPPYDVTKFPNKWRKMEANKPARTLMAHLGKDSYSHIHFDSHQARTISVREAARLQTFPDGFKFSGSMNAAFRQIGNAVPPLLSYQIAIQLRSSLV